MEGETHTAGKRRDSMPGGQGEGMCWVGDHEIKKCKKERKKSNGERERASARALKGCSMYIYTQMYVCVFVCVHT